MSGNNCQTYKMQRIGKSFHTFDCGDRRSALIESVRVPTVLGLKIRNVSVKTQMSDETIAAEAIMRGFELLKSNFRKTHN
jgi:hypothetical protein